MDRRIFNNPLSSHKVDQLLALLELPPDSRVLDVGCGRGEMLARIAERYDCRVVGVDPNDEVLTTARSKLARFGEQVTLHNQPAAEVDFEQGGFDAALCIGSTHAFGLGSVGLTNTLQTLKRLVRPGGLILVGEGFWREPPSEDYRAATGFKSEDHGTHADNVAVGTVLGLLPLYAVASTQEEWDHFESLTWMIAEDALREEPESVEARERADHWRNWRTAYLRWGRDTLGFGVYLFRVPDAQRAPTR